jgi:hypothetical protein
MGGLLGMPIIPEHDPNEAYELALSPESLQMPSGWYTVTCNGIPPIEVIFKAC